MARFATLALVLAAALVALVAQAAAPVFPQTYRAYMMPTKDNMWGSPKIFMAARQRLVSLRAEGDCGHTDAQPRGRRRNRRSSRSRTWTRTR